MKVLPSEIGRVNVSLLVPATSDAIRSGASSIVLIDDQNADKSMQTIYCGPGMPGNRGTALRELDTPLPHGQQWCVYKEVQYKDFQEMSFGREQMYLLQDVNLIHTSPVSERFDFTTVLVKGNEVKWVTRSTTERD
jgi:hypothetical protein